MSDSYSFNAELLNVNFDKTPVLWDINLSIPSGKLVGIIGPNGAGKSTLIKAAMGLIKPLSGKLDFFGNKIEDYRKNIAYIPQKESVDWDFPITVIELVLMGCYGKLGLFKKLQDAHKKLAYHTLSKVGMEAYVHRQISQLSGGQQQRVFFARSLMQNAEIYFLDEPFSGIDQNSEKILMNLLRNLRDEGKTIFIVHHDLNTVEAYFDWLIVLNLSLVASGPVSEVFNAQVIQRAYGKSSALLEEVAYLSRQKTSGAM